MFYPSRVVDLSDGLPKWTGIDGKSELMDEKAVDRFSVEVKKKRKLEKEERPKQQPETTDS